MMRNYNQIMMIELIESYDDDDDDDEIRLKWKYPYPI